MTHFDFRNVRVSSMSESPANDSQIPAMRHDVDSIRAIANLTATTEIVIAPPNANNAESFSTRLKPSN
jgi:hypothetical protein